VGNNYPNGISYNQPTPNTDLNVTLQSDVRVVVQGAGTGVSVQNFAGGAAVLTANGATIDVTGNPGNDGLGASAIAGNATISASGEIDALGGQGISAFVAGNGAPNAVASVIYNGGNSAGISSSGPFRAGIVAENLATNGNALIDASGNISGFVPAGPGSQRFTGLFASADEDGSAFVRYRSGTISVQGNFASGIFAGGGGSAQVVTDSGTTIIISGANPGDSSPSQPVKPGIDAESAGGTAAAGQMVTATVASTILMSGTPSPDPNLFNNPVAVRALSFVDAPISVTYTGPGITTQGGGGVGILALSGSGSIAVNSSGPITTTGAGALGIFTDSGSLLNARQSLPPGAGGPITVIASGAISTQGVEAHGIWASSTTGTVQVNTTNVSATGQFGAGINAVSTGINGTGGGRRDGQHSVGRVGDGRLAGRSYQLRADLRSASRRRYPELER
jgi:hypothetical protein